MAENERLVQLIIFNSQTSSSSLSPSSSSSTESSASPQTFMVPLDSPTLTQPPTGLRLRNTDTKVPYTDVSWEFDEEEKGKIQALLDRYPNLEELKKLDLEQIKVKAERSYRVTKNKVSGSSSIEVNNLVLTYSTSYVDLIKYIDQMADNHETIQNFIRDPFKCCSNFCRDVGTSADLIDYLEDRDKDIKHLNLINTQNISFRTADGALTTSFNEEETKSQQGRPGASQRPKESWLERCCWSFWDKCCCCCCRCSCCGLRKR